jgi:hypothetical protein
MAKEGYKPTAGMQAAARRAIKLKEQGKAKGAGTQVGWTRAGQLARGESLSLSTVKRMYSFFSRHEIDKQGKDWDNAENPSNGKIMWLAWGGDAGFSWSRKITQREKNMKKSVELNEFVEEIKDILDNVVNPIDNVIEIEDDLEKAKDKFKEVIKPRKGEPADKDLYARVVAAAKAKFEVYPSAYANGWVVQEYKRRGGKYKISKAEGIEDGFEESEIEDDFAKKYDGCGCETCKKLDVSCDNCPVCSKGEMNKAEHMTDTMGCKCDGCMECKASGGCDMKMCKGHDNMYKSENYYSDNEEEDKWNNMEKACWTGYRQDGMKEKGGRMVPNCVPVEKAEDLTEADMVEKSLFSFMDPYDLIKRKFTTAQRKKMAEEGHAMPDGSFPIGNKTDLMNAIRSWGRGGADPKVKEHIKRRAKALGASDMIPENWK